MPDNIRLTELVHQWHTAFGETLMMGWGVQERHAPVMKRCLEKGDPTEFHELIKKETAEYERLGVVL